MAKGKLRVRMVRGSWHQSIVMDQVAVVAGEAGAGAGAIWSITRVVTMGPDRVGWAGLGASVLSLIGMERWRRELDRNAIKLGELIIGTKVLVEQTRQSKTAMPGWRGTF